MHSAPAVTYPVRASWPAMRLQGLIWLAGCAVVGLWCWQSDRLGWRQGMGLAALLMTALAAGAATMSTRRQQVGALCWDGQYWLCTATRCPIGTPLRVALDVQRLVLVRFGGRCSLGWCWLERASAPGLWLDLRRALHARPPLQGAAASQGAP
ncbi:MAG: hypothetical protein ABIW85_07930 [Variovorax sp.]